MTPEQREALEALVNRSLTLEEIENIDILLPQRNDVAIAEILSIGRVKFNTREIGNGTLLEVLGLETANNLLDVINTDPRFKYVKPLLEQGRLVIGTALVQATLSSFSPAILTIEQVEMLKNLGVDKDPIHFNEVSNVLNIAEGRAVL